MSISVQWFNTIRKNNKGQKSRIFFIVMVLNICELHAKIRIIQGFTTSFSTKPSLEEIKGRIKLSLS